MWGWLTRLLASLRLPSGHSRVFDCKGFPPGGQRREPCVPAEDFGKLPDWKLHALGRRHERPDGKIADDKGRVWGTQPKHGLRSFPVGHQATRLGIQMRPLQGEPAHNICLTL